MKKNLIILGGMDWGPIPVAEWLYSADQVVAADGGANLLPADRQADVVVGDGDSIHEDLRELLQPDADQDTTDCEKALAAAKFLGWRSATVLGAEGDRLDHVLATLSACAESDLEVRLVLRLGLGYVVRPGSRTVFACEPQATISLLPITACVATMLGTAWPVEGATLEPAGFRSISNRAMGTSVSVHIETGTALLFVHRTTHHPEWE